MTETLTAYLARLAEANDRVLRLKAFWRKALAERTARDREIAKEVRWDILAKERIKKYPLSGEALLARAKKGLAA